ncbi:MAG: phosphoribosylglycinamide formyltransferase [Alphaproteobacteria bacterium]|nr:phosphoribosylglycinamide formyltransferase [Alphaproteobacteria bacterium]
MINYAVAASGGGSDFGSAIAAEKAGLIQNGKIVLLITENPEAGALKRAADAGINSVIARHPDYENVSKEERVLYRTESILKAMWDFNAEFLFLAGYLKKIPKEVLELYKVFNIHPALDLARFGGPGMYGLNVHQAVIDAGEKFSGATIHRCTEVYDCPDDIRWQTEKVPVEADDTPETLQTRILVQEHIIIPKFLAAYTAGIVRNYD